MLSQALNLMLVYILFNPYLFIQLFLRNFLHSSIAILLSLLFKTTSYIKDVLSKNSEESVPV